MLKTRLQHPAILHALAGAGHGAKILVADANYPFSTMVRQGAPIVYLNLAPGIVDVPTVVKLIAETVPLEEVEVNVPADGNESETVAQVVTILGREIPLKKLGRFEFYEACKNEQVCLVIATGETRIYSCVLLTIGYIG